MNIYAQNDTDRLVSDLQKSFLVDHPVRHRNTISLSHFFHWFEPAPLERLRTELLLRGFHCGAVVKLKRLGRREIYYQLTADRASNPDEQAIRTEIQNVMSDVVSCGVVYQLITADTQQHAMPSSDLIPISRYYGDGERSLSALK